MDGFSALTRATGAAAQLKAGVVAELQLRRATGLRCADAGAPIAMTRAAETEIALLAFAEALSAMLVLASNARCWSR